MAWLEGRHELRLKILNLVCRGAARFHEILESGIHELMHVAVIAGPRRYALLPELTRSRQRWNLWILKELRSRLHRARLYDSLDDVYLARVVIEVGTGCYARRALDRRITRLIALRVVNIQFLVLQLFLFIYWTTMRRVELHTVIVNFIVQIVNLFINLNDWLALLFVAVRAHGRRARRCISSKTRSYHFTLLIKS